MFTPIKPPSAPWRLRDSWNFSLARNGELLNYGSDGEAVGMERIDREVIPECRAPWVLIGEVEIWASGTTYFPPWTCYLWADSLRSLFYYYDYYCSSIGPILHTRTRAPKVQTVGPTRASFSSRFGKKTEKKSWFNNFAQLSAGNLPYFKHNSISYSERRYHF